MFSAQGYDALRHSLACVRRSDRGVLRLAGADRAAWLQGLITNDVLSLRPGHRLYSAYLTPQGRMITDLWVVASDHSLLLDVPAPLAASLAERLDGLIFAEDVQVTDVSAEMTCVHLLGPAARVAALPIPALPGGGVLVPDHQYGVPGLVAYGPLETLLADNGLDDELGQALEVNLDTLDTLRIEAGVPRFLVDMTEETIPLEAGIEDRAISFTKGCYVGQEIIVRVTTRGGGRVARKLVGLRLDLPGGALAAPPSAKTPIRSGERAIGHVTSAAWSPTLSAHIALGYVHRDFVEPGTDVQVAYDARPVMASVFPLPFVPPAL
jgi:folate-binding protein YgfZ